MLQSSGYFSNISCPYFASGFCERPHCHFKHVRKDSSSNVRNEVPANIDSKADLLKIYSETLRKIQEAEKELLGSSTQIDTQTFVTYIPTPKNVVPRRNSQESHIPAMCMPEYKPTPISQLRRMHKDLPVGDNSDFSSSVSSYKRKIKELYSNNSLPVPVKVSKRVEEYDPTKVPLVASCKYSTTQSSGSGDDDDQDNHADAHFSDSSDDGTSTKADAISSTESGDGVSDNIQDRSTLTPKTDQNVCENEFDVVTQILQNSKSSNDFIKSWTTRNSNDSEQSKDVMAIGTLPKTHYKKVVEGDTVDKDNRNVSLVKSDPVLEEKLEEDDCPDTGKGHKRLKTSNEDRSRPTAITNNMAERNANCAVTENHTKRLKDSQEQQKINKSENDTTPTIQQSNRTGLDKTVRSNDTSSTNEKSVSEKCNLGNKDGKLICTSAITEKISVNGNISDNLSAESETKDCVKLENSESKITTNNSTSDDKDAPLKSLFKISYSKSVSHKSSSSHRHKSSSTHSMKKSIHSPKKSSSHSPKKSSSHSSKKSSSHSLKKSSNHSPKKSSSHSLKKSSSSNSLKKSSSHSLKKSSSSHSLKKSSSSKASSSNSHSKNTSSSSKSSSKSHSSKSSDKSTSKSSSSKSSSSSKHSSSKSPSTKSSTESSDKSRKHSSKTESSNNSSNKSSNNSKSKLSSSLKKLSSSKHTSKSKKSLDKSKSGHRSDKSESHKKSEKHPNSKSSSKLKDVKQKDCNDDLHKSVSNGQHVDDHSLSSSDITRTLTAEEIKWFEDLEADLDNHDELEECWKIFNEDAPVVKEGPDLLGQKPKSARMHEEQPEPTTRQDMSSVRRRVAHNPSSIALTEQSFHKAPPTKKTFTSAGQAMANRFKQIQDVYLRQTEQSALVQQHTAFAGLVPRQRGEHRVAHVPNAARLAAMSPPRRNSVSQQSSNSPFSTAGPNVTVAASVGKGERRIAHVPIVAQSRRPVIPASYGNKVALNVRQRYLNLFIDECLKFATSEEAAYAKGLEEEAAAYDRSSNKTVYLNVVVNTLKRLRTEAEAGPPPPQIAEESPPSIPEEEVFVPHIPEPVAVPKLVQRRSISHEAMLGGAKAAKISYSIQKKQPKPQVEEALRGSLLYKCLCKYLLSHEQLVDNGYPQPNPAAPGKAIIKGLEIKKTYISNSSHRQCSRCKSFYLVDENGLHVRQEECVYHWGNLWKKRIAGSLESRYSCCEGDAESEGCTVGEGHVVDNFDWEKVTGFVQTLEKTVIGGSYGVYALDCEMCYTTQGMELTRLTVIGDNMKPIYETMVKPENPVLDYNTRFSGITKEDLDGVHTTLRDVQAVLLSLFNKKTILIGHSLESDFKALKLIHDTVVDTTVVFPHRRGPPFKRALRTLMAECLSKIIQNNEGGHDSQEDAVACLELMIWKIKEDFKCSR